MEDSKSSVKEHPEDELKDATRFGQSLQELKDLRSQLHHAADYCEAIFLNAKQKQEVVENTKEYVCRAIVTVVDHLGSVSANLEYEFSKTNTVSDAELRINCLKQKISTCEEYSRKQVLRKVCWKANFPRYHPRYISLPDPNFQRSNEVQRKLSPRVGAKSAINKLEFEAEEEVPLFFYTCNYQPSLLNNMKNSSMEISGEKRNSFSAAVLPVRHGISSLRNPQNPSFHFQETRKLRRHMLHWKSMQNNDFVSLFRRSKRMT
ncbi:hypothetical protein LguiB_011717 [Lonicera macranthoides]